METENEIKNMVQELRKSGKLLFCLVGEDVKEVYENENDDNMFIVNTGSDTFEKTAYWDSNLEVVLGYVSEGYQVEDIQDLQGFTTFIHTMEPEDSSYPEELEALQQEYPED